jgi:hypothetical protein
MKTFLNSILCLLLSGSCALATLTVTINPGYTFTEGERPTTSSLNQLGEPTATISGTVDGSTGLTAGSVTGTLLADGVPDGLTLDWNTASPRQLEVKLQGIHTNNFDTNVWSWPLVQGASAQKVQLAANPQEFFTNASGLNLSLEPTLLTNGAAGVGVRYDPVQLKTNAAGLAVNYDTKAITTNANGLTLTNFTSANFSLQFLATNGTCMTLAHGLGRTPTQVRFVFVCVSGDSGYAVGDEIDIESVRNTSTGGQHFNVAANATSIYLVQVNGGSPQIYDRGAGSPGAPVTLTISSSHWNVKAYARL